MNLISILLPTICRAVVNDSNPIDEISVARLGGIFGSNEELNLNTWGEFGLSGWGSRNIKARGHQR